MKRIIVGAIAIISSIASYAFSGSGAGTEKSPYLITSADELFEVRSDMNAYYKLVNDIDLGTWLDEENPQYGWNPIGSFTTPFKGHFDGNKKSISGMYINRDTETGVGLFGCILNAEIKNLSLVNPTVKGDNYVSALVGSYCYDKANFTTSAVSNVIVIAGNISSHGSLCGSIAGSIEPNDLDIKNFSTYSGTNTTIINGCYSSANIQSDAQAGGICGRVICGDFYYYTSGASGTGHYYQSYKVNLVDNAFDGTIEAQSCAGILASIETLSQYYYVGSSIVNKYLDANIEIQRNIVTGSLYGERLVEGISCGSAKTITLKNNFCLAPMLSSNSGSVFRISQTGQPDNFAFNRTIISQGGQEISVEDNSQNGSSYGSSSLHRKSTYAGAGFDFISQWNIVEGETFPFNIGQCMLPVVTKFESGSKGILEGTSPEDGKIFVVVNQKLYSTNSIDKSWKLTLGKIGEGEVAKVSFKNDTNHPSIIVSSIAEASPIIRPDVILGDSNSDGVVDAADVVGTINYILGKPSSSFNQKNADINEDGQILVDDAVGTVNVIMNNQ